MKGLSPDLLDVLNSEIDEGDTFIEIIGGAPVKFNHLGGEVVDVSGRTIKIDKNKMSDNKAGLHRNLADSMLQFPSTHRKLAITGLRTVLVLRVTTLDSSVAINATTISRRVFG
eukprot:13874399-Ditylum_brightwellii.AAC.1